MFAAPTTHPFALGPLGAFRPPPGSKARAAMLAFGAVLCWATWPSLASFAQPAPPFLVFGLAALVGFAVALGLAVARGEGRAFAATPPRTLLLVTAGLMTNNILYLAAMPRIGPAEANVVAYLWPILLVGILAYVRRRRLGAPAIGGMVLSFVGASLAIGPTFTGGLDALGLALAFGSGLAFAIYAAIRSQATETHDVIGPSMGLIALVSLGLHAALEAPASLSPPQMLAIAGIGLAPLTLSNALWNRASRTAHTTTISAIAYGTPLAALGLLAGFGAASVTTGAAVGAVLVVIGAMAASGLIGGGETRR